MQSEPPLYFDALPTVANALRQSLIDEGEQALADGLVGACVHALCECEEADCMSFYLSPPLSPCPGEYRVVLPSAVMTAGVCDEQIGWVQDEVLDESDEKTHARLREYLELLLVVPRREAESD
jgi:hypothetical protein